MLDTAPRRPSISASKAAITRGSSSILAGSGARGGCNRRAGTVLDVDVLLPACRSWRRRELRCRSIHRGPDRGPMERTSARALSRPCRDRLRGTGAARLPTSGKFPPAGETRPLPVTFLQNLPYVKASFDLAGRSRIEAIRASTPVHGPRSRSRTTWCSARTARGRSAD